MGPSKPKSTQEKSQKSISSFFTPKVTVNGRSQAQASKIPPTPTPKEATSSTSTNFYNADTDDDESESNANSGTSKRVLAENAHGGNGQNAERPAKRSKINGDEGQSAFFGGNEQPSKSMMSEKSITSPRTDRYLYTASGQASEDIPEDDDDSVTKARKEQLHKKFVKKLGHPDSIAQIKRRNWQISEETEALDGEDGEEGEEEARPLTKSKSKGAKTGKLTPMETQILDIKRKHMDTILIVEVGYKFRFYGEDARIAAKELGIVCIPGKFRYDERKVSCLPIETARL